MGLILPQEVEVGIHGTNKKRYLEKGYYIPTYKNANYKVVVPFGTKIKVDVRDLPDGSKCVVKVECDNCHKVIDVMYQCYVDYNHDGKYYCNECNNKVLTSGENNHNWNYNLTDEEREIGRQYQEYHDFVKRVLARDDYSCISCGNTNRNELEVHHLDGYNWCKEKRTEDDNGVTLCNQCHGNFHLVYGRGGNTEQQFKEWLLDFKQKEKYKGEILKARQVYIYEDNEIFRSAEECAKHLHVSNTNVYFACNRPEKRAKRTNKTGSVTYVNYRYLTLKGKHLFWLDEYEKMTKEEIDLIISEKNKTYKSVLCLNTGKVYDSLSSTLIDYPKIHVSNLTKCCKGITNTCGKDPITNEPLRWMYYEDYLKEQELKIKKEEDKWQN